MKHYIICKFKDKNDLETLLPEITELYKRTLEIEGVEDVKVHKSNSERENRFHIMIEMTLTPEGLEKYDVSEVHHTWKKMYGDRLEGKTIFDCE